MERVERALEALVVVELAGWVTDWRGEQTRMTKKPTEKKNEKRITEKKARLKKQEHTDTKRQTRESRK